MLSIICPADVDVNSGNCRIHHLLITDDLVLLVSSEQDLQHALDRFLAACDRVGRKISTINRTRFISLGKPK